MNVFVVDPRDHSPVYIAGIFEHDADADAYIAKAEIGYVHHHLDLTYPFWIKETFRTNGKARFSFSQERPADFHDTLYRIDGDYQPEIPWTDYMGMLPHEHAREQT